MLPPLPRCSAHSRQPWPNNFPHTPNTQKHTRFLEEELARRYRDAAPSTLAVLQERCEGAAAELVAAEGRLRAASDVTSLRHAAMQHVFDVSGAVGSLLSGAVEPDPQQHGLTTEEERSLAHAPAWPGVAGGNGNVRPVNAGLRLFGGAAFERVMDEFQQAAAGVAFPQGASRGRGLGCRQAWRSRRVGLGRCGVGVGWGL